jgi:hypothetical protein
MVKNDTPNVPVLVSTVDDDVPTENPTLQDLAATTTKVKPDGSKLDLIGKIRLDLASDNEIFVESTLNNLLSMLYSKNDAMLKRYARRGGQYAIIVAMRNWMVALQS